jgi:pilus assembly protein Flp/PilA
MGKAVLRVLMVARPLKNERGQDLVEYALLAALIALAATAGMNNLATGINTAFTGIATALNTAI